MPKKSRRRVAKRARKGIRKRIGIPRQIGYIGGSKLGFPFPAMLRTRLQTSFLSTVNLSSAGVQGNSADFIVKLNALMNQGIALNYPLGTQSAFANNVPSGLAYLLSQDAASGGSSPYFKYIVTASKIFVQFTTTGVANTATQLTIFPSAQSATIAETMSVSHVNEQPLAKSWIFPPVMNDEAVVHKHSISVRELGGLTSLDTTDHDYSGQQSADPLNLYTWYVRLANADGSTTTTIAGVMKIRCVYDVIFYDRNFTSSAVPI